jgi:small subunit ribosomal protein S9
MADSPIAPVAEDVAETEVKLSTKKTAGEASQAYWSVGRRKNAVARIKMWAGQGDITINDVPAETYYPQDLMRMKFMAPLALTDRLATFDISIKVAGGGKVGQADAIAHGISRALLEYDANLRPVLKKEHLLTRDPRMKERKKYGLRRARKAPQYSKR